ncbi:MAG: hypothetical protein IPL12_14165 [Bacteroidetes bacterium]|nr:hypothetical protein [Bacteroidota bacterium]
MESLYLDMPFDVKFKSAAYKDMKVYVVGGIKYCYDFQLQCRCTQRRRFGKNKSKRPRSKLRFGFEFYFPYFIFSPK